MKKLFAMLLVIMTVISAVSGQGKVSIKPSGPRMVGPPPLPLESDVLRYVFEHFPDVDKDSVMAFIGDNFKSDLPEFRKLAVEDASRATVYMMDLVSDALELMAISKKDKDLAMMMIRQKDLERSAVRKAKEVVLADEADKPGLKDELRKMLEQAFDAKQELMKRDLSGIEDELKKLNEMIAKRSEYRKQIIDRKLNEMTVEENYLKW